jgi:hypothetical protein
MKTGLQALQKIVARMKGNPKYSKAMSRPRRTGRERDPQLPTFQIHSGGAPKITRGQLRELVESKGQDVGTIREKFQGMPQQFESWMRGGPDEQVLRPRRASRDKLKELIEWLEGL